jgi:hypothetical protein
VARVGASGMSTDANIIAESTRHSGRDRMPINDCSAIGRTIYIESLGAFLRCPPMVCLFCRFRPSEGQLPCVGLYYLRVHWPFSPRNQVPAGADFRISAA